MAELYRPAGGSGTSGAVRWPAQTSRPVRP